MTSGDDVLGKQLETALPDVEYATVKNAVSLAKAEPLPQEQSEDGKKTLDRYRELVLQRWLEPEKLPEWARDKPAPPPRKRFHGDN